MGRAIVRSPRIVRFDGPLSNFDARLRVKMQGNALRQPSIPASGALDDLVLTRDVAITASDLTVGGGAASYALAPMSDPLPAGLSLSGLGSLAGTPTAAVVGAIIVVRRTHSGAGVGSTDAKEPLSPICATSASTAAWAEP